MTKLRARGKGSEKWQCNSCNSKCVALSRICGGWPNQDFKDLPLDQQQSFFKDIAGKDAKKIRGLVEDLLERIEKKETNFSEGGAFLPLSVWDRKGFNVNDIKEKSLPCDKREHRVLGDTYRVRIEALTKSNTTSLNRAKRICGAQAPPTGTVASGLGSTHPQSSMSTSQHTPALPSGSCSLNSPDGFADMQARVKAHADKVKEAVKITVTMKKVSTSNEEKSRKILDMFSRLLQDPSVANAPREILGAMKHFLEDVARFHDECSVDMVNPSSSNLTPETAKQVSVFAPARAPPPPSTTFSRQMESGGGFGNNGR